MVHRIKSWFSNIYYTIKFFITDLVFLKTYFSPFKPLKIQFYFGKIAVGVPYFYPRKTRKITSIEAVEKALKKYKKLTDAGFAQNLNQLVKEHLKDQVFVDAKWLWLSYCGLGWKTKWSDTDFRHEWDPTFSLVILNRQLAIRFLADHSSHYWESWLYYEYATDKSKSKYERIQDCIKNFPNIWTCNGVKTNYYHLILRKKYLKYIKENEIRS